MLNLDNIKIRTKLISGFIIVAIIVGIVGFIGITNLKTLNNADTFLFEKKTKPMGNLINIGVFLQGVRINLHKMFLASDFKEIKELQEGIIVLSKIVDENLNKQKKSIVDKEDETLFDELINEKKNYIEVSTKIYN
ncbi:MCP four helix bundle domain-containing protein, partial [Candidatus Desantisbacteria bacterium]|nr:MCP four helix bundle domain-containing protein [Candidatus Desantisbacteria bacterium]